MSITKTNAIRLLDAQKIEYDLRSYPVDGHLDAQSVAQLVGLAPELVFKTLVTRSATQEILVFVIPGNTELNLKKAASIANTKHLSMLPLQELTSVTGYQRGGCSPMGMKKLYRTFIDETAVLYSVIAVSAGRIGTQMLIKPDDLTKLTKATLGDLT